MKRLLSIVGILATLSCIACGGSGGGDSTGPSVSAALTADGPFKAGDSVPFAVSTSNFKLAPPFSMRPQASVKHNGEDHSQDAPSEDSTQGQDDSGHNSPTVNPTATEGHYHVYLDDAAGADKHMTAWSTEGSFELPPSVTPGTHSLRFELRDNSHVKVGVEDVLFFDVAS